MVKSSSWSQTSNNTFANWLTCFFSNHHMLDSVDMSELQVVSSIQQAMTGTPLMSALSIFLARYLIFIFVPIAIYLLMSKRPADRHAVNEAAWAVVIALAATAFMARAIKRPRPFMTVFDPLLPIHGLIPPPLNTSFPSGHTATAFAIAAAIYFANRKLGIVAIVIALLIALGRIAVGAHYPSDVIGGIAVGLLSFAAVRLGHNQVRTRDIERSVRHHHHS
jgi:undecaprenyl-diphosphatase